MVKWFKSLSVEEKIFYFNTALFAVLGVALIVLKNGVFSGWDFTKYAAELELNRGKEDGKITLFIAITCILQFLALILCFFLYFRAYKSGGKILPISIAMIIACVLNAATCLQYFNVLMAIKYSNPLKYLLLATQIFHIIFTLVPIWLTLTQNRTKRERK